LGQYLEFATAYAERLYRLMAYASAIADADTSDKEAMAMHGQLMGVFAMFNATTAFAEPEMQALGDTLQTWATQESQLALYAHYFDNLLRQKAHTRSPEVEEILSMVMEPFAGVWSTMGVLTNAELKFAEAKDNAGNPQPVSHATIPPVGIQSPDREHRRTAWESYCDGYLAFQNTLASNRTFAKSLSSS
jgi:oligoendopeptidase F